MRRILGGKVYDTEKMERLFAFDNYNNGNYVGETALYLSKSGSLVIAREMTDKYLVSGMELVSKEDAMEYLEGRELSDSQAARLLEIGLILED